MTAALRRRAARNIGSQMSQWHYTRPCSCLSSLFVCIYHIHWGLYGGCCWNQGGELGYLLLFRWQEGASPAVAPPHHSQVSVGDFQSRDCIFDGIRGDGNSYGNRAHAHSVECTVQIDRSSTAQSRSATARQTDPHILRGSRR